MNKPFLEIGAEHFSINAFEIKPLEGYEKPINEETKKELPFCCEFHEGVHKNITDHYNRFPNCCEWHKPLNDVDWFNKEDFKYIIDKVVNQISYTEHCIQECINDVDWYNAITEYIDFNISSFGQLKGGYGSPVGLSVFTFQLKHYITNTDLDISKSKRKALINFFEVNERKETDKTNKTDLNVLYATYQKWLKVFPFYISFFANLKEQFENQLPILNGKPEINRYSKIAKVRLHTKDSLIDVLLKTTNNIVKQINPYTLYEKGLLTEPKKIKLELVLNEMRIDNERGYSSQKQTDEQQYRDILKKWFNRQKRFIDEVTPLVKALPPQPIIESPFSVLEWATIFYYVDETKLLSESRLIKTRFEQFMSKHEINTTFDNFKTKYYKAKKRINEKNDYPINKLELIIPFLKENYKQTVTKVENDIIFLEENKPEY